MTSGIGDLDEHFAAFLAELPTVGRRDPTQPIVPGAALTGLHCLELFEAQAGSRHLDLMARQLGKQGKGFYSIGSSGHESNAALAAALRPSDPALVHYRSGAFYLARLRQYDPTRAAAALLDVARGLVAASTDRISGGRHKVFGDKDAAVIPVTSTIASHLPRAVGLAFAIDRGHALGVPGHWPADAVVMGSFGDASANHSTAVGAINAAAHCAYQRVPMPMLFVCEDNGIGLSVRTPAGWIDSTYGHRTGLRYFEADGSDLLATFDTCRRAVDFVRTHRAPAVLRLRTVRLMGHAGSDVESSYRTPTEIAADYVKDPVCATARLLATAGVRTPAEILAHYQAIARLVTSAVERALAEPRLSRRAEIVAPLTLPTAVTPVTAARSDTRRQAFPIGRPEDRGPLTLAQAINATLVDLLAAHREILVFGEDLARKGGVYGVTKGLHKRFGANRVFDTLLDEQTILGTALGAGLAGFIPVPEIQYLAYLHNALDQIRGEAASMSFFSTGQYRNPMVVRIASYAYQKGFGGHFHNDNSVAALRDIPGIMIASPARPDDAAAMLRTCVSAAHSAGTVSLFLEPIALYHIRDLYQAGDDEWLACYPAPDSWPDEDAPLGRAREYGSGRDLVIVTFANGLPMSLRVARRLTDRGFGVRVLDLRWLSPLPVEDLLRVANATGRVLVADETRRTGGVSEAVLAALLDAGFSGSLARVNSADTFVPLGPAAEHVLLTERDIEQAAITLIENT